MHNRGEQPAAASRGGIARLVGSAMTVVTGLLATAVPAPAAASQGESEPVQRAGAYARLADPAKPSPPEGGGNYSLRVVGGHSVPEGKYRFMASLQLRVDGMGSKEGHFCGGTLISPQHVLTAAHCIAAVRDGTQGNGRLARELSRVQLEQLQLNRSDPLSAVRVAVGGVTLNGSDGSGAAVRRVRGAAVHPGFARDPGKDVAVLTLQRPVADITPIDLAATGSDALERPGTSGVITGWGNTVAQPHGPGEGLGLFRGPNRMQAVEAPIVADATCESAYPADYVDGETAVCAGKTDTDACQGDSGGPLFKAVEGGYRQIGITSRGFGCGATGYPGIWTQVSAEGIGEFIEAATARTR